MTGIQDFSTSMPFLNIDVYKRQNQCFIRLQTDMCAQSLRKDVSISRNNTGRNIRCLLYTSISVLTEPKWFLGSDAYLREIAKMVSIPCSRKDFTVDEYQIYQAKTFGAAAVLLICSILSEVCLLYTSRCV